MRTARPILILVLLLLGIAPATAQISEGYYTERDAAARNLIETAMLTYRQGVEQQDEELFWESVQSLTHAFQDYGDTNFARDNFLTAVEILCKKIGTEEAYDYALQMLEGYQVRYGDEMSGIGDVDAQLSRDMYLAQVEHFYTYRHDYQEAARRLNKYYELFATKLTASERARAKLMEARVQRKQGDFAGAKRAYGVAEEASRAAAADAMHGFGASARPLTMQQEIRFCEEVQSATLEDVGDHLLYGLPGVSRAQLQAVAKDLESAIFELGIEIGADPNFPLDIFVFAGSKDLQGLTGQEFAYVLATDGEIYVTPGTPLKPLLAQVSALSWRVRPISEVPQVLAEGLPSAMGMDPKEAWRSAAGARAILGKSFTSDVIIDPALYDLVPDRGALAAAYVQHLLKVAGPTRFGRLFAGWEVIGRQSSALATFGDLEHAEELNFDGMKRAFRTVIGQDYDTVWNDFSSKLATIGKAEEADFQRRTGGLRSISVIQDSPEAAVTSWVKAMAAGDIAALDTLAAKGLKAELSATFNELKAEGSLDAVRLWTLAMPYSELTSEIESVHTLGGVQREVTLLLKHDGELVRRAKIVVYEEGGKWRLATGL